MRSIFASSGNKGGGGKTCLAMAAVDYFLTLGHRVAVVETDTTQPDVRNRFQSTPGLILGELDLAGDREGAVVRLGTWIESKAAMIDAVVVNSPAGGGDILDPFASILEDVCTALDFMLIVPWTIGPTIEDSESVLRSLDGGLLGLQSARRSVCLAGWMGDPATWPWARSPVRRAAAAAGVGEIVVPRLTQQVMSQLVERNTFPLATLCDPAGGLSIASRSSLVRWRAAMHAVLAKIIAGSAEDAGSE